MRGGAGIAKAKLTLVAFVVAVIFEAAPHAAAVLPKRPYIEGCQAIILEVEGAPSAKASCAGKRLPAVGQDHAARGGDLSPTHEARLQ